MRILKITCTRATYKIDKYSYGSFLDSGVTDGGCYLSAIVFACKLIFQFEVQASLIIVFTSRLEVERLIPCLGILREVHEGTVSTVG